jgi:two-component system sensor histidine kinase BaeS
VHALVHLFDRLYRVDRSRSRTYGGSLLGLSIGKSIVAALAGEIRALNGNSGGLRVEVELPLT